MARTKTFSLLTILFSLGLLMLGAGVHSSLSISISKTFDLFPYVGPLHQIVSLILATITLVMAFSLPTVQSFFALMLIGVMGIISGNRLFYVLPTVINTVHFFLGMIFVCLVVHLDHRNTTAKSPLAILDKLDREGLKVKLKRSFHFSDGLAVIFFLSLCLLTLMPIERQLFGDRSVNESFRVLRAFIFLAYWIFGTSWLEKVRRAFKGKVPFIKVLPFLISANSILLYFAYSSPSINSELFKYLGHVLGLLSLAGIWKVNLIVRDIEKSVLGEERFSFWSDLLEITKPRLGSLVMSTVFVGIMLAPRPIDFMKGLAGFTFTFILVMGAAAFNCWMEIDVDKLMDRTKDRPLPTGRMKASVALAISSALMIFSIAGLYFWVNGITALLGFIAAALYVFAYTPLKQKSVIALYVGAIPGAIPPVMGWTIVMGKMTEISWALFAILFVWQLPHFLAISIYHAEDYGKASIKVYPNSFGLTLTKWGIFLLTGLLAFTALYPWLYDVGVSDLYGYFSIFLNAVFLAVSFKVLLIPTDQKEVLMKWARIYFFGSIFYLPLLLGSMIYLS